MVSKSLGFILFLWIFLLENYERLSLPRFNAVSLSNESTLTFLKIQYSTSSKFPFIEAFQK